MRHVWQAQQALPSAGRPFGSASAEALLTRTVQPLALTWLEQTCPHKWPAGQITPGCRRRCRVADSPVPDVHPDSAAAACLMHVSNP